MNLSEKQTFQVNNVVYVLGSPVIPVETLEQLAYSLSQQDTGNRPIVIINPQANTVPDFDKMLENYIENYTAGKQKPTVTTSYAFELSSDADIEMLVSQQFQDMQSTAAQQQVSIYRTIRQQSQIKHRIADYQAEAEELWRQHCINPNATEGSERYAELVYQLLPEAQLELKEVSELLSRLNTSSQNENPIPQTVENHVENSMNLQDSRNIIPQTVENHVENPIRPNQAMSDKNSESVSETLSLGIEEAIDLSLDRICLCDEWRDTSVQQMPRAAAENLANSVSYQKYRTQQSVSIPGYQTVELWVLCQLGIPMYPDGVPIVYTVDGKFQRIGVSDRSVLDTNYWFPRPIFENYYENVL